jgi:demethylmenaquinone methyltransferase/2-methoxy-6-polyprenyl-1,4-benzoquinol methylase
MNCTGCGTGNFTIPLSEYVGKVTGLEVNEGMLGRAMEKTANLKNVSLTQGDVTKMPFPDNQFDGICCIQVHVLLLYN